jgi:glycosyltransferase involved in cell wall biosynthesis
MRDGRTSIGEAEPTGPAAPGTTATPRRDAVRGPGAGDTPPQHGAPAVLLLSTADWDRPLWTNKQHLAVQLAAHGLEVTYIDSLGFRRPRLAPGDARRIVEKLGAVRGQGRPRRPVPPGVEVVRPLVVPFHRSTWPSWRLNRTRVRKAIGRWAGVGVGGRVLWTFSPITYDLEEQAAVTVYHCVDLLEEVPGYDRRAIREGELRLARRGALAIASSSVVRDHLVERGFRDVRLWENVADTEVIAATADAEEPTPGHVVFAGNLTTDKVDVDLLAALVEGSDDVHLHLAGPLAEGGASRRPWTALLRMPRVHHHGVVPPEELGGVFGRCTVGLIPYHLNRYTRGVFPMKLHEYLAAGLGVVSTDLPSLPPHRDVRIATDRDEFLDAVRDQVASSTPDVVRARRQAASQPSWTSRGEQAIELLAELLDQCSSGTSR